MRARLSAPSLFLALALTLTGPASNQAKTELADHSPSFIQQAATGDTLLPATEVKPCVRKPDDMASAKFVNARAGSAQDEPAPRSLDLPGLSSARALCLASSGGGRAPPSVTLA
jgi:hypothetical protein